MSKRIQKKQCKLFPVKREEVLTIQDASQKLGWAIEAFNLPETWTHTQGENVIVAVLDTGISDHDDLRDNILPGMNFVEPGKDPIDRNQHATHVTGIICALNNDIGIVGVAPKTKIIPVKVLDDHGNGDLVDVAKGIRWAAEQKVDFIVMSLGSPRPIPLVHSAIKYAASKGVVTFCAAGNAGKTRQIFYPAAYPECIGIGAIDEDFNRANFSCTGPGLDFLAPGKKILSTVPNNWYALLSGSSMGNPFAAGIACLVLSYKRKHNLNIKLENCDDYINVLKNYTMNTKNFTKDKLFEGFGIIDPRKMEAWFKNQT